MGIAVPEARLLLRIVLLWLVPVFEGMGLGILAMVLHEAGHLAVALCVGLRIRSVGIGWKGMYLVREPGPLWKNLLVSFAGPCINLLLSLIWFRHDGFSLANLCFGLVNLLPIEGSDGDRILGYLEKAREIRQPAK